MEKFCLASKMSWLQLSLVFFHLGTHILGLIFLAKNLYWKLLSWLVHSIGVKPSWNISVWEKVVLETVSCKIPSWNKGWFLVVYKSKRRVITEYPTVPPSPFCVENLIGAFILLCLKFHNKVFVLASDWLLKNFSSSAVQEYYWSKYDHWHFLPHQGQWQCKVHNPPQHTCNSSK